MVQRRQELVGPRELAHGVSICGSPSIGFAHHTVTDPSEGGNHHQRQHPDARPFEIGGFLGPMAGNADETDDDADERAVTNDERAAVSEAADHNTGEEAEGQGRGPKSGETHDRHGESEIEQNIEGQCSFVSAVGYRREHAHDRPHDDDGQANDRPIVGGVRSVEENEERGNNKNGDANDRYRSLKRLEPIGFAHGAALGKS